MLVYDSQEVFLWHHCPPCGRSLFYDHALWHVPDSEGSGYLPLKSEWSHGWNVATYVASWRAYFQNSYSTILALTHNLDLLCLESVHMQWIQSFVVLTYIKGCDAALSSPHEVDHSFSMWMSTTTMRFCWSQATSLQQEISNISDWGLYKYTRNIWQLLWITLNKESVSCATILHCNFPNE